MNFSTLYWITKKAKMAIEKAKSKHISHENSSKSHNKTPRKPEEKVVIYSVETKAKVYVFLKIIAI
jgi:hypothetical protein